MSRLDPATIELLIDTLANSFWYKRGLIDFLRRSQVPQSELDAAESQGAKYKIVRQIVSRYEQSDRGHDILRNIAENICRKTTFLDLSIEQQEATKARQELLRQLLGSPTSQQARTASQSVLTLRPNDIDAALRVQKLATLQAELTVLCNSIGTAAAGRDFETWITRLAQTSGLEARGRYSAGGREFDGSICVDSDVYLVEAKFRIDKADAAEISNLRDKVCGHADGSLGLFVSMGGFTSNAVDNASRAGTPLVLIHSQHLFATLGGTATLDNIIRRSRRHAKETGCPLLEVGC